jgi:Big-like domain-containing protein
LPLLDRRTVTAGVLASALAAAAGSAAAADVGSLFPSDRHTVLDLGQNTFRRVKLPRPDCSVRPSDCADIDVLNTLDGFNLQPRLTIPFDEPIDVGTVSSESVFLVSLGSTLPGGPWPGHVVGINQVVWDSASLTLYAETDELLDQHTRYLFVVTDGVRDLQGGPARPADRSSGPLAQAREVVSQVLPGVGHHVLAATLFTTQSATSTLEKIRRQIKTAAPPPVDFALTASGDPAVFAVTDLTGIVFRRQVGTTTFAPTPVPVSALGVVPGAVGRVAFGRYASPNYETAQGVIPQVPTRTGTPAVQRLETVYLTLFLPSGPPPAQGWPVALFGHGLGDNKNAGPWTVAAILAQQGVATAAINVVGHGFGPASTLEIGLSGGGSATVSAGGRAVDQNGDGQYGAFEGVQALPPYEIVAVRDGLQQTVADLMRLVRAIEGGVDVDGDGQRDLDASRIYSVGQSFGGIYGTMLMAVEPNLGAGVANAFGGSIVEAERLGTFRPLLTQALALRTPSLLNLPGGFAEDLPLRDQPPLVDPVAGALPIQELLDRTEWVSQPANAAAFAPHLRTAPLSGVPKKSMLFQFAKGDQTVPNPTATAVLRAGHFADRATYFRNDLAFAADPTVPKNPHSFLTRINVPSVAAIAFGTQRQIATFLASNGTVIVDPDGAGPLLEVPIAGPLPEDLAFIP